jgi:hypothetical protein
VNPDNLSSKDKTESGIIHLLEVLPPLGAAALSTLVGYQLHPVLPVVHSSVWMVLWLGTVLVYAGFRNTPGRAKVCLLACAVLGGVILKISPGEVNLAWPGLVFAGWLGVARVLGSMGYRRLQAAAWAVGLISWFYLFGWVYLFFQDQQGRIWLAWTAIGGLLFAYWIAGSITAYLCQRKSAVFPVAGDLYILSFNLFLVSVFSVHFFFELVKIPA